jgi:hypothetical protein
MGAVHDQDVPPKDEEASAGSSTEDNKGSTANKPRFVRGFKFWAIMVAISITTLLTTLEATIVSTALPTIITELNGANKYIWVSSGYLLTM